MHTPGRPRQDPILGSGGKGTVPQAAICLAAAERLRQALRIPSWPLAPAAFPAGTALVGGAVRDGLLGRLADRPDLDLVVSGDAIGLCRELARRHGGSAVVLDAERSMARLVLQGWTIDLARCTGEDLEADLGRRDFRVNAMALPLAEGSALLDPLGGLADLAGRRLTAVSEANLLEDPLRLLRGVRLAAELDFNLEAGTWSSIHRHHGALAAVAAERILAELEKLTAADHGEQGLGQAVQAGLLNPWLADEAGLAEAGPGRAAMAAQLAELSCARAEACGLPPEERQGALALARWACLVDGPQLASLHASRRLQQRCHRLRHWRQRLAELGAEQLRLEERLKLHQQLDLDLPALALSLPPATARQWMERWCDPGDPLFHPRSPLDGHALQEVLGLGASPRLGALLAHLTLERARGQAADREAALACARRWLGEHPAKAP